jgi:hypothetical protein
MAFVFWQLRSVCHVSSELGQGRTVMTEMVVVVPSSNHSKWCYLDYPRWVLSNDTLKL